MTNQNLKQYRANQRGASNNIGLKIDRLLVFRGQSLVINQLTHYQSAGEICCVKGANGAGKSTLLRTLAGRLPAASGSIFCAIPRIYVGHADGLSAAISGRENLRGWAHLYGFSNDDKTLDIALGGFGAKNFADTPVRLLSRGQRRRLALSRLGLAPATSLWLLDEPTAGLDQAANESLDAIIATHTEAGGMVLAATHVPLARSLSQSTLILGVT